MSNKIKIAVSVGDLNGIGFEILLTSHNEISKNVDLIYCISKNLAKKSAKLLDLSLLDDMNFYGEYEDFLIEPSLVKADSGKFSFLSFKNALDLVDNKIADGIVTMPINKLALEKADILYKGHTDYLRDRYKKDAIMMLGCQKMFCALYSDHVRYKDVPELIDKNKILDFLISLQRSLNVEKIAVLGLNPHAGDGGVLGDEDFIIAKAIEDANSKLNKKIFYGPMVPDVSFTPKMREEFVYFACMYHDQGLIPIKTLYFDESINVSLGLPIIRASVDHGTAFDIAYKSKNPSTKSYINAINYVIEMLNNEYKF